MSSDHGVKYASLKYKQKIEQVANNLSPTSVMLQQENHALEHVHTDS